MSGYKETELGQIPQDWDVIQLRNLVDPARSIRYGIVQPGEYEPSGRLLVRGQDYSKGWVDADEMFRVSSSVEERYINARLKAGDLIITIVGAGTGHIEEVPGWLDGANLTQTTARIAVNPKKCDSTYLKYILLSEFGRAQVSNYVKGAAQPGLNCGDVEKFVLPVPRSIEEQKEIGAALFSIDELVSGLDKLIVKKRDIKQAAMQNLLTGQHRLPGFNGEWEMKRLGDVAELKQGYTFQSSTYTSIGEYNIVTIANVQSGYMDISGCSKIDFLPSDIQPHQNLKINDILISMTGNVGRVCRVSELGCLLNQRVGKLSATSINDGFFFHQISTPGFIAAMVGKAKGGAQANLSTPDIAEYLIQAPKSIEEQDAIAVILSDIDNEIATLETRCDKARQLKQGMMQELLTGKIRLSQSSQETKLC